MNAYELADELDALFTKSDWEEIPNVVSMLRQQADRIAELEKQYDAMVMSFEARLATRGYEIQIKDQQDRIAELEKPHKYDPETGEPLIDGYPLFSGLPRPQTKTENTWTSCSACGQKVTEDLIHTCSPQTKPLSNDEIREIGDDCVLKNNGILNWIEFAKAIEERHGIK